LMHKHSDLIPTHRREKHTAVSKYKTIIVIFSYTFTFASSLLVCCHSTVPSIDDIVA
jgi:hypothetical protein